MSNNAIAYCRCSTDKQEESIPDQKKAIQEYAGTNGLSIIHYFEDDGKSGRRAETRPGFMAMIKYAEEHNDFKFILCYDQSRWGRLIDSREATYWEVYCNKRGKQILYTSEPMTNDTSLGGKLVGMLNHHGATEYALSLSKTSFRGHKSYAEKGFWVGGQAKYGYARGLYDEAGNFVKILQAGEQKATKTQHVKLVVNSEQAKIVEMIFDMRTTQKMGIRSIADKLNRLGIPSAKGGKWSSSTLWYMMNDEVYTGDIVYNKQKVDNLHEQDKQWGRYKPRAEWVVCPNAHEAIVSKEQFAKVSENKDSPFRSVRFKGNGRTHNVPYVLSGGLMVCASCGHRYQGHTNRSHGVENNYYICGGYQMKGRSVCKLWYIPRNPVEKYVIEGIRKRIEAPRWRNRIENQLKNLLEKGRTTSSVTSEHMLSELKNIETRIDNLLDALETGLDRSIMAERIKALQARKEILTEQLQGVSMRRGMGDSIDALTSRIMGYMGDFENVLKTNSLNQVRLLLDKFILPLKVDTVGKGISCSFLKVPMAKEILAGQGYAGGFPVGVHNLLSPPF